MKNLLITGKPGIGKTTFIEKLANRLPKDIYQGFYTEEIREKGRRVGFKIATFEGKEQTLAHVDLSSHYRVGKYFVDVDSIDNILDYIINGNKTKPQIFLVDEIGKMESFSEKFRAWIESLLSGSIPLVATIALGGNQWINSLKNYPDTEVFTLTLENRNSFFKQLYKIINDQIGS